MMGRRTVSIGSAFLPILMGEGEHHYQLIDGTALPKDCRIIDARMDWGGRNLVLLLESEDWEPGPQTDAYWPSLELRFQTLYPQKGEFVPFSEAVKG